MSPADRFVETATAPLEEENPELQLRIQQELRERIDSEDDVSIEEVTERLKGRSPGTRWVIGFGVVVAVLSLLMFWRAAAVYEAARTISALTSAYAGPALPSARFGEQEGLTEEERLILFGSPEALWNLRPDHPPYFARYVGSQMSRSRSFETEWFVKAEEIDPDNGWYWMMAAGVEADGAVERQTIPWSRRKPEKLPGFDIKDPAKVETARALIRKAIGKPRWEDYSGELTVKRMALLPEPTDYFDYIGIIGMMAAMDFPSARVIPAFRVMEAEIVRVGDEGDREGYAVLRDEVRHLMEKLVGGDDQLVLDRLIAKAGLKALAHRMEEAAAKLGHHEDEEAFGEVVRRLDTNNHRSEEQEDALWDVERLVETRAGSLGAISLPILAKQSMNPVPITEAELEPMRRAEYALLGRSVAVFGWLLVGLLLLTGLAIRQMKGKTGAWLPKRLVGALGAKDWAWIIGLGWLAPVVWYVVIAELSPLAVHEWNMRRTTFMLPLAQPLAALCLLLIAPVVVARWRLSNAVGFLGVKYRVRWIGWTALAAAALSIPVLGLMFAAEWWADVFFTTGLILLGLAALWLVATPIAAFFTRGRHALGRDLVAVVFWRCCGWLMLLMVLAAFAYEAAERRWVARDEFAIPTAEEASMSRYEFRVARQLGIELREAAALYPDGEPH